MRDVSGAACGQEAAALHWLQARLPLRAGLLEKVRGPETATNGKQSFFQNSFRARNVVAVLGLVCCCGILQ